jgi:hypothetical protein
MFTLLTHRIVSRLGTSSAIRGITRARVATTPSVLSSQTRRTFLTGTPHLSFAPAAAAAKKTTTAKKSTTKKTAVGAKKTGAKKATATKSKAKKAAPKKSAATKKSVAKKKKPAKPTHPKLTKADLPPRRPVGPYVLFFMKYLQGLTNKPHGTDELMGASKEASQIWKSLSEAEKQPFHDEAIAARAAYTIRRQTYFETVPASTLSEINRRRKVKGQSRLHRTIKPENRRPLPSFFRFIADFRTSPDAQAILNDKQHGGNTHLSKVAGKKWMEMSDAEKAPYLEGTRKDTAAWLARKSATA